MIIALTVAFALLAILASIVSGIHSNTRALKQQNRLSFMALPEDIKADIAKKHNRARIIGIVILVIFVLAVLSSIGTHH